MGQALQPTTLTWGVNRISSLLFHLLPGHTEQALGS